MILRKSSFKFVQIKMISYQRWLPGVWPVLCNSNFKNLLLWNHWSEFNNISRERSLGGPLSSLFKSNWYLIKHSCQWVWPVLCNSNFKNLLLWNNWSDFINIWQKWSLGDIHSDLLKLWCYLEKHSPQWVWPVSFNEFFENVLLGNYVSEFNNILQKRSLGGPLSNLFKWNW